MVSADCEWCTRGWVCVGTSKVGTEETGPCPHCDAGRAREARHYPNGFWQGRDFGDIEPRRPPYAKAPMEAVRRYAAEINGSFARIGDGGDTLADDLFGPS